MNGEAYREKVSLIMKRARDARAQANYRAKKNGKPLPYPTVRTSQKEITPAELEAHAEVQSAVRKLDEFQRNGDRLVSL